VEHPDIVYRELVSKKRNSRNKTRRDNMDDAMEEKKSSRKHLETSFVL
jgi:hypothetical protein